MRLRQPAREFWRSTPARVAVFSKAYEAAESRVDYRAGLLAALIANQNRRKGSKVARPTDFFPSLTPRSGAQADMTAEEMRAGVLRHFGRGT